MDNAIKIFNQDTKNHIVEHIKYSDTLEKYSYHDKNGNSIGWMDFIIDNNKLFVSGDYGEVTFVWSDKINIDFLANCDFYYFIEKCYASEFGRKFLDWNEEFCIKEFRKYFKDNYNIEFDEYFEKIINNEELNQKYTQILSENYPFENKEYWHLFLQDNRQEFEELTEDYDLMQDLWDMGETQNIRAIYMWQALRNIKKLLEEK